MEEKKVRTEEMKEAWNEEIIEREGRKRRGMQVGNYPLWPNTVNGSIILCKIMSYQTSFILSGEKIEFEWLFFLNQTSP